jgi:serine/threonine-protein kinase
MVLELCEGRTIGAELADDGPLAPRRAVRVARQVCAALGAAHKVGLIHRDLKPDNLMLVRRGADPDFVKVLDFGLAKVMEGTGEQALSMASLTQGGIVFGTPDYMAPEQALGQELDARCDLYALGATLFEMLTGQPPFPRSTPLAVLAAHVRDAPPRLVDVAPGLTVPAALEDVVAQCLAKEPDRRPPSAEALYRQLAAIEAELGSGGRVAAVTTPVPRWPSGDEVAVAPRRRRAPVAIAIVALAVAALVVIAARTRGPRAADRSPAIVDASHDAPPPPAIDAGVDAAPATVDAGASPAVSSRDARAAAHLAAAQAAHRAGNRLRQLAEADAALQLAPRNRTARYLVGDALVGAGDLSGCAYLKQSGLPAARTRAQVVGCP